MNRSATLPQYIRRDAQQDEMERWRLREIERELLEIAARARVSTADHAAALMAELQRIERVMRGRGLEW